MSQLGVVTSHEFPLYKPALWDTWSTQTPTLVFSTFCKGSTFDKMDTWQLAACALSVAQLIQASTIEKWPTIGTRFLEVCVNILLKKCTLHLSPDQVFRTIKGTPAYQIEIM